MQPYFFPYLGYFDLISAVDRWVVFDTAQYIRHGWVNRNRILHPAKGWQYIGVPLRKHRRETPISSIEISTDSTWRSRLLRQLNHYRKKAPRFDETIGFVEDCLAFQTVSLSRLNVHLLAETCRLLGVKFEYDVFSEMELDMGPVDGPGDWALRICEAMGATEYINPPGGVDLFDPSAFESVGVNLTIRSFKNVIYPTPGYEFVEGLSVIDMLLWNAPEQVRSCLNCV